MTSPAPMSCDMSSPYLLGGAVTPRLSVFRGPGNFIHSQRLPGVVSPDVPSVPLRREGGECCPAPIHAKLS